MKASIDLSALAALDRAATPGPWYVRAMDDGMAMCATCIATEPNTSGDNDDLCDSTFTVWLRQRSSRIMITLFRQVAVIGKNAELIATGRSMLPELLRLARIGMDAEQVATVNKDG